MKLLLLIMVLNIIQDSWQGSPVDIDIELNVYNKDDIVDKDPEVTTEAPCESPSIVIEGLGCITYLNETYSNWPNAQLHCSSLGGRLLQGIVSRKQLKLVRDILLPRFGTWWPWLGIFEGKWVGGEPVPSELWAANQTNIANTCAVLGLSDSFIVARNCSLAHGSTLCQRDAPNMKVQRHGRLVQVPRIPVQSNGSLVLSSGPNDSDTALGDRRP